MTKTINILLVDDHPLVRDGLRARLEAVAHFDVVAEAGGADEALAQARLHQVDLVLMDINMRGINGIEATALFKQAFPQIAVLILSMHDKLEYVRKLKESGKKVMMIGDGLNDAGALNESHLGISIADDIYHFSPACDAILESQRFTQLPQFVRLARYTMRIVKASFVISFLYNTVGISIAVSGKLSPVVAAILMPLSSVTVVAFVTLSTLFVARKVFGKIPLV